MSNKPDRNEIYQAMELKSSEQLLYIWVENDHVSWHDEVFDVIKEILENREEVLPEQQEAIVDEAQREKKKKKREFINQEKIINFDIYKNEEQPVFYNPKEVLQYVKKLKYIAYALIISMILSTLISIPEYVRGILVTFSANGFQQVIIWVVIIITLLFILIAQAVFIYYFIRLFGKILLILMEMEFVSRTKIS
jgi:hypothetical protein